MARESFRPAPSDRTKIQVITDDTSMRVDLDGKIAPVPVDVEDREPAVIEQANGTTKDPAEWGDKNAEDPKGVTPRVQKRFDRLKAETATQERLRLQAEKDRDDAVRAAAAAAAEVNDLRQRLAANTTTTAKAMSDERTVRIADAKRRVEQAHAEGNSADMATATADLSRANAELLMIEASTPRQPAPRAEPPPPPQQQQQPAPRQPAEQDAPQLHEDAVRWIAANPKFNSDSVFRGTAMAIDTVLAAKGIRPGNPNYLAEVDRRMKAEYPDHQPLSGSRQSEADDEAETITPRRTNAVAPGSRDTRQGGDSRTMDLSPEQVAIARSLGLTTPTQLALYATKIQERDQNKRGA